MRAESFLIRSLHTSVVMAAICGMSYSFCLAAQTQEAPNARKTIPEDSTAWRREPFKKVEAVKPAANAALDLNKIAPEIKLQGIMKIDKHFYAIINGRTVKTGDRIDEWTVASINRHRVTVRRETEQQTYDIYQGRINRGTP